MGHIVFLLIILYVIVNGNDINIFITNRIRLKYRSSRVKIVYDKLLLPTSFIHLGMFLIQGDQAKERPHD